LIPAVKPVTKVDTFDPRKFLTTIGEGMKVVAFLRKKTIFKQGETADAVFYIQEGKVTLSVVSKNGKEATLGVLNKGDFFGEGSLAGQQLRMGSANAMTDCEVLRIDSKAMMLALHREHAFSELFIAYLLARNIRYEEDLVDQLFNFERKAACPASAPACTFWQGERTGVGYSQDEPGNLSRDGRHNPFTGEFFYEPVQGNGIH
jgi:CRP-like cAMP-binding protein